MSDILSAEQAHDAAQAADRERLRAAIRAVPDQRIGTDGTPWPLYPAAHGRSDLDPATYLVDHACPGCGKVARCLPTVDPASKCAACAPVARRR